LTKGNIAVVTPRGGKWIRPTLTPYNNDPHGSVPKRYLDWFSRFAYTTANTSNAFQWCGRLPKMPLTLGGSGPHL